MSATRRDEVHGSEPPSTESSLLELIAVISEVTEDEHEIVSVVLHMLASGRVLGRKGAARRGPPEDLVRSARNGSRD
jgi:hypothetical protein